MVYVKTFKGYEDKTADLDNEVNNWLKSNGSRISTIRDIKTALSHQHDARSGMGDLIYTVVYEAGEFLP